MRLSKKDLKALAREARKLAFECLTNGPEMKNLWCGCAVGIALKRAHLWKNDWNGEALAADMEAEFSGGLAALFPAAHGILSAATRERVWNANPTAVVIPLLAWADDLNEAAVNAPKAPSKAVLEEL